MQVTVVIIVDTVHLNQNTIDIFSSWKKTACVSYVYEIMIISHSLALSVFEHIS